jgi:hypothetical protein
MSIVLGLVLNGTNEDLELETPPGGGSGSGSGDDSDDSESDDSEGGGSDDSEGGGSDDDDSESDDSEGGGSDDGEAEEDDGEAEGSNGSEGDEEGEGSDDGESSEGEGDEAEGEGEGKKGDNADPDNGKGDLTGDDKTQGSEDGSDGAGGVGGEKAEPFEGIAQELLDALLNGESDGLCDNNEALKAAVLEETDEEAEPREAVWRPYSPGDDTVELVSGGDARKAKQMQSSVKKEIAFLRAQLRNKFLQARQPEVIHGVRKGRELSERRLVGSVVELRSGRRPTRPDWQQVDKEACTLRCAVVLDESSSMGSQLAMRAGRAGIAIAQPLDELGSPCLVVGPRSSYSNQYRGDTSDYNDAPDRYHRVNSVHIDVFKDWYEPMRTALPRFSQVQSVGGTPLSDGIQYALTELNDCPERFRVCFVVTDGMPNCPDVVRRQIRLAAEAGVYVVGVGISAGCYAVKDLFPVHVAVHDLKELPRELMKILTGIMFPNKGRRIALDGRFGGQRG